MQYQQPLTSFDDLVSPNWAEYAYEKVLGWITSCNNFRQIEAAKNATLLYRKKYPEEKNRYQTLYRTFWKIKRELNNN